MHFLLDKERKKCAARFRNYLILLELRCRVISSPSIEEKRLFLSENCTNLPMMSYPLFHHGRKEGTSR